MNRILYVPLDERACNYEFPALLAGMTEDVALVEPPVGWMVFKKKPADIDALWAWLFENAGQCSHAILSVDTLVYGNIINSRTHHRPLEVHRAEAEKPGAFHSCVQSGGAGGGI